MNRSTFTQSGELVTISRLKIKEKWKFLRSLRFRITVILVIIGIVPCVILEKSIVNSYEDRAVSVRSITVKNQCDIICNQLIQQNYMEDPGSDVISSRSLVILEWADTKPVIRSCVFSILRYVCATPMNMPFVRTG